jgi:hypothetical protein
MSDGGELATIRAFANKAGEHVVRVAGVRTIYADADAAEIADAAVADAIDLVQHYLGEAMRLRGMEGEGAHLRRTQDVLDFIKGIGRPVGQRASCSALNGILKQGIWISTFDQPRRVSRSGMLRRPLTQNRQYSVPISRTCA